MFKTQKSIKAIANEVWKNQGKNVFSGKDTLIFINRESGLVEKYEKVFSEVDKEFTWHGAKQPDMVYGGNGFHRATWVQDAITKQTKGEKIED